MNTDPLPQWHARLEELLMECRTRRLTAQEHAELNGILRNHAEARSHAAQFLLDDVALTDRLRESQVEACFREEGDALAGIRERFVPKPRRSVWLQWRPLTAAAAGLAFGMFSASMVFAYASPKFAEAKVAARRLWAESFESGVMQTLPGLPRECGVWSGDETQVVTAERGVKPRIGAKMLRFVSATYAGENAKHSAWGDVYRLVDLRGQVGDAKTTLRLTAAFNAVNFSAGEEYSGSLELCALEEELTDLPQPLTLPWVRENSVSTVLRKITLKGDGAWKGGTVEVPVSPQTRFVLVHLAVLRRKPYPPTDPVQFSGHYLDDVKVELRTQPNTP